MPDKRQLLAIMFTDIQGFSAMMGADEATTVRVVREHREVVREGLARHGGREMRTVGDAFLVLFESALEAVRCAIEIQEQMAARNTGRRAGEQVWMRIGLHAGEVVIGHEGELYGEAVNVAARVEPYAPPGGICLTDAVHAQVRSHVDVVMEPLGRVPLKNIVAPPALYRLALGRPAVRERRWGRLAFAGSAGAVALLAVVLAGVAVVLRAPPGPVRASADPEAQAMYEAALESVADGQVTLARQQIEAACARDPGSSRIWFVHHLLELDRTRADDALAKAVVLAPPGPDGDLVRLYDRSLDEPDSAAVAAAWDAWAAAHPEDVDGQFVRALAYPMHGHEGLAGHKGEPHDHAPTVQLRAFVAAHPEHVMARLLLAPRERGDQHPEAARAVLEEALEHCEACAGVHQALGDLAMEDRDFEAAEGHYRMSLELDSGLPGNRQHLADLAAFRGDETDRVRRVDALLADDGPIELKILFALGHGHLLMGLGRHADGRALTERGIELARREDPALAAEAYDGLIAMDVALGLPALARTDLEALRTVLTWPEVPGAVRDRGLLFTFVHESELAWLEGDVAAVEAVERRLVALPAERFVGHDRDGLLRNARMHLLGLNGDLDGALALASMPAPGCGRFKKEAEILERGGRAESALRAWEKVAADGPRCGVASVAGHLAVGEAASRSGDLDRARGAVVAIRSLWPRPDPGLPYAIRLTALEAALAE